MAVLIAPLPARSDEAAPSAPRWYDAIEMHGLVDTYYSANLSQRQDDPTALRVFDAANGFQLSYAKLAVQLAPTRPWTAGFRADVGLGTTASALLFRAPSMSDVVVEQAYASFALPGHVIVDAGKFVTNAGAEVIEAKDDWLYSRSVLYGFAVPFTHTGVRAAVPIPGARGLSVMAGIFDGWDNPPKPVGSGKTGHLALMYAGPSDTSLVVNALYGRNPYEPAKRLLVDAVASRSFGDVSVNVNVDWGTLGAARYWGVAGMARYRFLGDRLRLAARGEYLDDSDGSQLGPPGNRYAEGTLGVAVPVGANAELRIEGRHDHLARGALPGGGAGQTTIQAAALAWF